MLLVADMVQNRAGPYDVCRAEEVAEFIEPVRQVRDAGLDPVAEPGSGGPVGGPVEQFRRPVDRDHPGRPERSCEDAGDHAWPGTDVDDQPNLVVGAAGHLARDPPDGVDIERCVHLGAAFERGGQGDPVDLGLVMTHVRSVRTATRR